MARDLKQEMAREVLHAVAEHLDASSPSFVRALAGAVATHWSTRAIAIARRTSPESVQLIIAGPELDPGETELSFGDAEACGRWLRAAESGVATIDLAAPEARLLASAGIVSSASAPLPARMGFEGRLLAGHVSADASEPSATSIWTLAQFVATAVQAARGDLPEVIDYARLTPYDYFAMIGKLSGGLVHEVNNPATFIALAAGQLEKTLVKSPHAGELEPVISMVREVGESIGQIRSVVSDFHLLSSVARHAVPGSMDLARMLRSAAMLTSVAYRTQARIDIDFGDLGDCPTSFASLAPAVVHLLINSIQSIPQRESASYRISLAAHVIDGSLRLSVQDTGPGFENVIADRIGVPFVSTREPAKGAGLGLTMVRHIAGELGGSVSFEGTSGQGTRVEIVVPVPA